jgi:ABC-type dipeptide/oligopeptide/nickel transport system permease subunit
MTEPDAGTFVAAPGHAAVEAEAAPAPPGIAPEPGGRRASLWSDAWSELRRNPIAIISSVVIVVVVLMAIVPGLFTQTDPRACDINLSKQRPSSEHWFGTDNLGCDYYAQTIYGARASISVGVLVTLGTAIIGILVGSAAGFYGGILDALLSRASDIVLGIPLVLGAIVILTVIHVRTTWTVALVLMLFYWPTVVRIMRSTVIGARNMDYVQAAKALGASNIRVIRRHVLPNAIAPVIVVSTINLGIFVAVEATLSYLGVGLARPSISWGLMISDAQAYFRNYPHLLLFPALFLSSTVLSFILLGDSVRDALDPRLR